MFLNTSLMVIPKERMTGRPSMLSPLNTQTSPPWCAPTESIWRKRLTLEISVLKFDFAKNPNTRRRAHKEYESRLAKNAPVLQKIIQLRHQIASNLGYSSWSHYITEVNTVKNPDTVIKARISLDAFNTSTDMQRPTQFLTDLRDRLLPVATREREVLLELKKEEHREKGYPTDDGFHVWDHGYYRQKYLKKSFNLDINLVKEYFPVSSVVPKIIDIFQKLFKIEFKKMDNDKKEGHVWHAGNVSV